MKAKEQRELKLPDLQAKVRELRQELFSLRVQYSARQLTNTARLRAVRRDLARLETQRRTLTGHGAPGARG